MATFSAETAEKFEAACASIFMRSIDRAFSDAGIPPGDDPGGPEGTRRTRFRQYLASVDQRDPQDLARLGRALGALVACVATSKEAYLIGAAESDGFAFRDGTFVVAPAPPGRPAPSDADPASPVRLRTLAESDPGDAIRRCLGELEATCRDARESFATTDASPRDARLLIAVVTACIDVLREIGPGRP